MQPKSRKKSKRAVAADSEAAARLLQAARALFAAKGYEAVGIREIAAEAGCNLSLIQYYYGGKQGLYLAIFEDKIRTVRAALPQAYDLDPEPLGLDRDGFRAVFQALLTVNVQAYVDDPDFFRLAQRELVAGAPQGKSILEGMLTEMMTGLIRLVEYGKRQGFVRADLDPLVFLLLVNRGVDGYLNHWDMFGGPRSTLGRRMLNPARNAEALVQQMVAVFLDGALTP